MRNHRLAGACGRSWISLTIAACCRHSGGRATAERLFPRPGHRRLRIECHHVHVAHRIDRQGRRHRRDDRPDRDVSRSEHPVGSRDLRREVSSAEPRAHRRSTRRAARPTAAGQTRSRSTSSGRTRSRRAPHPGGRGGPVELADPGAAEPLERREHCAKHAGRGGGLDELGLQRDAERVVLRLLFHDAQPGTPASRSSPPAETTASSSIRRPRPTFSPSAGLARP